MTLLNSTNKGDHEAALVVYQEMLDGEVSLFKVLDGNDTVAKELILIKAEGAIMTSVVIAPRHDFTSKLRQESVHPNIATYAAWRRLANAVSKRGESLPPLPSSWGPTSINLDLTTSCNYACDHCVDIFHLNTNHRYVHDQLMASLKHLISRNLRSVILIGGGEPTVYPKFSEVVEFLKASGVQVAIVSNGSRNESILQIADKLNGRDWVRLSLDSGTDETFIAMHKPKGRKPKQLSEICAEIAQIRTRNPSLSIGFSYIITWEGSTGPKGDRIVPNIHEVPLAAQLARDSGFSYISYKAFLAKDGDTETMDADAMKDRVQTLLNIKAAIAEAKKYERPGFHLLESTNLKLLIENRWQKFTRQPHVCHVTPFRLVLSPLGFFNCPANRGKENARIAGPDCFASEEKIGATLSALAGIIESFDAKSECAKVTCLYNSANWALEDYVNGDQGVMSPLPEVGDYFL